MEMIHMGSRGKRSLFGEWRLNNKIKRTQKEIEVLYTKIGKRYTAIHLTDYEEALGDLIDEIHSAERRIEIYENQARALRGICRCANCGAEVPVNLGRCRCCGQLLQPTDPLEPGQAECPNCGEVLESGMSFCPYCGMPTDGLWNDPAPQPQKPEAAPPDSWDTTVLPLKHQEASELPEEGDDRTIVMPRQIQDALGAWPEDDCLTVVMPEDKIPRQDAP